MPFVAVQAITTSEGYPRVVMKGGTILALVSI